MECQGGKGMMILIMMRLFKMKWTGLTVPRDLLVGGVGVLVGMEVLVGIQLKRISMHKNV